jgi:hypothetical protein
MRRPARTTRPPAAQSRQGECGYCFWRGFPDGDLAGLRSGALGPGLTSESADAVRPVLRNDLSAGSQVFVAPTGAAGPAGARLPAIWKAPGGADEPRGPG